MAPATLDISQPLDDSFGVVLIGVIFSAVLHGFCITQALAYFRQCRRDGWLLKAIVVTTVVTDSIHLLLVSSGLYYYLISSFHKPERLEYLNWTELIEALCVGVNAATVQTYYTYRIYRLSKGNYVLCGFVLLMIIAEVASGLAWVILTMRMKTWRQLLSVASVTVAIDALSCFIDVVIAGSLIAILNRSRTGFKRSDTIINRLIIFVINTGMIFSISSLIAVVVAPQKMLYAAFYFCVGRLYTNSLLTTLNSRSQISNMVDTEMQGSNLSPRCTSSSGNIRNLNILVETTTQEAVHEVEKSPNILGSRFSSHEQMEDHPSANSKGQARRPDYPW